MRGNKEVASVRRRRRLLQYIAMLCRSGAGLQAITVPFCAAAKELLDAKSSMLIWFDESEVPLGFYHDSAPPEIKDLFISNLDAMFLSSELVSGLTLARNEGPLIGKMLDPALQQAYFAGNIFQHLCQPLGDHHLLDMRAHAHGVGVVMFGVWNAADRPFGNRHVMQASLIQPQIQKALEFGTPIGNWRSTVSGTPHLIADQEGRVLLAIDQEAEAILMKSHLLRQNISMAQEPRVPPGFVAALAKRLKLSPSAEIQLPVPDGRLVCKASRTQFFGPEGSGDWMIFVSLDQQVAEEVATINFVIDLDLSPLQKEIAAFALGGGERHDCIEALKISSEALKKHLRAIFEATGTARWLELQQLHVPHTAVSHTSAQRG